VGAISRGNPPLVEGTGEVGEGRLVGLLGGLAVGVTHGGGSEVVEEEEGPGLRQSANQGVGLVGWVWVHGARLLVEEEGLRGQGRQRGGRGYRNGGWGKPGSFVLHRVGMYSGCVGETT
jgi:hypothetical protein